MKLSIAMCTYNGAAYLLEQLESLAAQTCLPDELVVCDDGSNDRTFEIITSFARQSPFPVRLSVNRKTLGSKKNFEHAISLCQGAIIFLCDQDDVWRADKLKLIEETFLAHPTIGLVFTDAEVVDEDLRILSLQSNAVKIEIPAAEPTDFFPSLLPRNLVTGATLAFRSNFRRLVLPIPDDTILQHDGWVALIIAAVAPVIFLTEPLIKYRQHAGQQIGVEIKGSRFEKRASPLIRSSAQYSYRAGEIAACKTLYARLITRCSKLVSAETLRELKSWIVLLENEAAVLENENAPAKTHKEWEEMQRYLESRIIRAAPYIWRDILRLGPRLRIRELRQAARAILADRRQGINRPNP